VVEIRDTIAYGVILAGMVIWLIMVAIYFIMGEINWHKRYTPKELEDGEKERPT
jgi:uncharacterized membrane protein YdfJ with MMPL/SSD domain